LVYNTSTIDEDAEKERQVQRRFLTAGLGHPPLFALADTRYLMKESFQAYW